MDFIVFPGRTGVVGGHGLSGLGVGDPVAGLDGLNDDSHDVILACVRVCRLIWDEEEPSLAVDVYKMLKRHKATSKTRKATTEIRKPHTCSLRTSR